MYVRLFAYITPTEPVGSKAPAFSNDATSISITRGVGQSFGLLCLAQAFPVPLIRLVIFPSQLDIFGSFYLRFLVFVDVCLLACMFVWLCVWLMDVWMQSNRFWLNVFLYRIEPIGYKAPSLASAAESITFKHSVNSSFGLLCQAQAFPVPVFR